MESYFTEFVCGNCRTEIQASADMIGQETECPACGTKIIIPAPKTDGIIRHARGDDDPDQTAAMKSRTIRIELGDL